MQVSKEKPSVGKCQGPEVECGQGVWGTVRRSRWLERVGSEAKCRGSAEEPPKALTGERGDRWEVA